MLARRGSRLVQDSTVHADASVQQNYQDFGFLIPSPLAVTHQNLQFRLHVLELFNLRYIFRALATACRSTWCVECKYQDNIMHITQKLINMYGGKLTGTLPTT